MKKLLLGIVTALMTLTATLYGACTADVNMGGNKITNLANATEAGNAVTYEQVFTSTQQSLALSGDWNISQQPTISFDGQHACIFGEIIRINTDMTAMTEQPFTSVPSQTNNGVASALSTYPRPQLNGDIHLIKWTNGSLYVSTSATIPVGHKIVIGGCWIY
jgi:hypothetical protein